MLSKLPKYFASHAANSKLRTSIKQFGTVNIVLSQCVNSPTETEIQRSREPQLTIGGERVGET